MIFHSKYLTVRAGSTFHHKGGSVHHVNSYLVHEEYYLNEFGLPVNDIAILKVIEPFTYDKTRQPIHLSKTEIQAGKVAVVTGWGNTGNGYLSEQLQSLALPVITKEACNSTLKKYKGLGKGQMCTKYEGVGKKDACNGDSGGPLTHFGMLVGIVSYGDECEFLEYPGMYTEIAYFYDWIITHSEF